MVREAGACSEVAKLVISAPAAQRWISRIPPAQGELGRTPADGGGCAEEVCVDVPLRHPHDTRPHDEHDVQSIRKQMGLAAEGFANEPLGPVALDRSADLARGDDAQPARAAIRPAVKQRDEEPGLHAHPGCLDTQEIRAAAEPVRSGEGLARARVAPCHAVTALLLVDARSKPGPTLAPAVADDLTPTRGGHPGSETVRASAAGVVGLVGAFHGYALRIRGGRDESTPSRPGQRTVEEVDS
jgi:hypothetical protein